MPIELKMPALSPTMEEGTLAKWLVKEGDSVKSGDLLAEIETDKATMEFEAVDEGTISRIVVPAGGDAVKVGAVIALIAEEGEDVSAAPPEPKAEPKKEETHPDPSLKEGGEQEAQATATPQAATPPSQGGAGVGAPPQAAPDKGPRITASPLAKRLAGQQGIDLGSLTGSGPGGRIVKADLDGVAPGTAKPAAAARPAKAPEARAAVPSSPVEGDIPHEAVKLSNMRKVIARRLTESKQTVPHIYLTVDINIDRLLALRGELNGALKGREIKLSVNDLLIKALAAALIEVPACNVSFAGDQLIKYARADISVAVSIPGGLITPIVVDAGAKGVAAIAGEMKELAARARDGKLQPHEYQGGTASLSNMGMYGIKQFEAVINPPQGMIMAIGAGEKRPYVVGDALAIATVMSATGSFDHRAIDGADGAALMAAFKRLVEQPVGMLA